MKEPHPNTPIQPILQVLVVEHNAPDAELSLQELRRGGFDVRADIVTTREDFAARLKSVPYDVILVDYRLPGWNGIDALEQVHAQNINTPVIMVTGTVGDEAAVEFIKRGLADYVLKDRLARLPVTVRRALEEKKQREAREHAEAMLCTRARQHAALAQFGQRALTGLDLQLLCNEAVAIVARTLDVEYCKVLELLPDGSALLLRAGVGWKEGLVGNVTVPADKESQAGYTLLSKSPVIVTDLRTESRFQGPPLLRDHGVISGLSVIIPGRPRPFGVLGAHTTSCREFTEEDVHFLQTIAHTLAVSQERSLGRQELEKSESKYRTLVETTNTGCLIVDTQGRVIDANAEYIRLTGHRSLDEIRGRSVIEWTAPYDRERNAREVEKCAARGFVRNLEIDYTDAKGHVTPILINASVVETGQGRQILSLCSDITERRQAQEVIRRQLRELEQERAKLTTLSRQLMKIQEEERRRLGRELHDQVGQLLTAIRLNLAVLHQNQPGVPARDARRLQDALGLVDQCLDHIRNLSYLLRPPLLEEAGLLSAVRWFLERYTKLTAIRVDSALADSLPRMPQEFETAIFRVLQESLTNVTRHAQTTAVQVELKSIDRQLRLVVADQGRGFDPAEVLHSQQAGVGLIGMQERMRELGGKLEIQAGPGQGTRVCATLPLPEGIG